MGSRAFDLSVFPSMSRAATPLNDAFKCTHRNRLVAVHGDDYLATIGVAPFLVTSLLAYLPKAVPPQHPNDIFGTANRKALAHLSATSSTFAPGGNVTGAGSNQRSSASLAFRTASSSVSPAEAHPGNSGKNAAQRLVWGSCSITSRSFMGGKNNAPPLGRQTANE